MSNAAVKPGYKLTELGVIPEDWSLTTLGDVVDKIVGGGTPSRSNSAYWGNEIPWVTVKDFATFNSQSAQEYISSLGLQNSSSNLIPQGTLITSTRMALGKAIIYDVDVAINQDLKAIFPKRLLDTKFLYFWFQQNSEFLEALGSGSTVMGLSLIDLKNTKFLLPPLPEQKAIAAALSDVDALITAQEALIAKKRDIKTATMQQLLTGQVRLGAFGQRVGASGGQTEAGVPPGYQQTELGVIPEDWEVQLVKEAFEVCNQYRLPLSQETRNKMQGQYPYYGPTRIQDYINEYRVEGTFALIGEDGDHFLKWDTVPMTQLATGKFNVNNHAHLIKGTKNATEWFYYFFKHRDITPHLSRQGANRYKLNKATLENMPCLIPPLPEQKAIAEVLSDMDAEITALEAQRDKIRVLKQGMMQELLTGKTRLVGSA